MKIELTTRPESVRQFCIVYNLYTMGSCDDYNKMFEMVRNVKKVEDVYKVAVDIECHSEGKNMAHVGDYDANLKWLMFEILNKCSHFIVTD